MSTATLQPSQQQRMPRAASAQDDRAQLRPIDSNNSRSASHPHPSRQHEKDLVLKHAGAANSKEVMPPDEISKDPEKKQLGYSSRHLKISDFELMRTLGTGMERPGYKLECAN